jgi:hypothetical protein
MRSLWPGNRRGDRHLQRNFVGSKVARTSACHCGTDPVGGSSGNITPYPRKIVYLALNAVSNYIRTPTRPEYIAHHDFAPSRAADQRLQIALGDR